MFNPDQFIVSEPQYKKITDGGRWLPNAITGGLLVDSIPEIDRGYLKIETPDYYLQSYLLSDAFTNAIKFLKQEEGLDEFSAQRFNQKRRPLIEKFSDPNLIDTELHMGNEIISSVKYIELLTNQGLGIEFRPANQTSEIPSLRIESNWIKGGGEGEVIFQPKLAVFKERDLGNGFKVGTQMKYRLEEFQENGYTWELPPQTAIVQSLSMPPALVDFVDPINNMRDIKLDFYRFPIRKRSERPNLILSVIDSFNQQFELSDYLVVLNQRGVLGVANKSEMKGEFGPNTEENYGYYVKGIADNLLFLLGEKLTGKRFVDLTP